MEHQDKQQREYQDLMKSIEMPFDLESQWDDIEQRLPEKSKKRRGIVFWFFGILSLVAIGMILMNLIDDTTTAQELESKIKQETYSSRTHELSKGAAIPEAKSSAENKDDNEVETLSIENINEPVSDKSNSSIMVDERNISKKDIKINQQSNRNIINSNASSIDEEELNNAIEKDKTYLNIDVNPVVEKSNFTTQINTKKLPTSQSNDTKHNRLVEKNAMLDARQFDILLSQENLIQTPKLVKLNSPRINKWTVGLSQQISSLKMLFGEIAGEPINPLNDEIKSTYRTKTSLFAMRNMNNRFSIYGGFTFRLDQERIEAERIVNIQERDILSNEGSLYIDNLNQTTYYEGTVTETTTTKRKIGQNNTHKSIGLQLGMRYHILGDFYLNGNVSQHMVFASKGKTISIDNEIIDLKNTPRNGGIDLEIGAGYAFRLTKRLKFDAELNIGNTFNQQSHINVIKQSGTSIGGTVGIRFLINNN